MKLISTGVFIFYAATIFIFPYQIDAKIITAGVSCQSDLDCANPGGSSYYCVKKQNTSQGMCLGENSFYTDLSTYINKSKGSGAYGGAIYCSDAFVGTGSNSQDLKAGGKGVKGCSCISAGGTSCGRKYVSGKISSSGFTDESFPIDPESICVENLGTVLPKGFLCAHQPDVALAASKIGEKSSGDGLTKQITGKGIDSRPQWTKTECESIKRPTGEPAHLWIPPANNPAAIEGNFCFMKQLPTNLQIHIGETYVVEGVANYINIVYKYGLGLGVIIMIITIMFSGIQWMVSGVVDKINDAKQRIMNASLGLLLLFGASTLLNTINPQLINLRTPPIHAVRPESFELAKEGKRCDPGVADSCAKYGAKFKCKPTDYYAHAKCQQQFQGFLALTLGGAAGAVIGPFLIPTSGVAAVAEQGAGHMLKEAAAEQIKVEAVEQSIDAATNKNSLIAKGVFAVTGASLGSLVLFADDLEATDPASGYCVEIKPEKSSFSVCQYDGECQSGKCLLTSSGACGAGRYGVCTSGAVREACLIPKSYSFGLIDALSNEDAAKKYKCNQGSCVDNGRGATKSGVGLCSDGSDIGLPCGDGVSCTNKLNALTCVNGFCREKNYFSDSGVWSDIDVGHPRCMLPTDCSDGIKGDFWKVQSTQTVGCLKNPNSNLNLPARLLVPQINKSVDASYVRELSSYGRCVTGNPFFVKTLSSGTTVKIAQSCFVNVYPDKSIKKVGCGKGACGIFSGLVTAVSAVTSIKGECAMSESNDKTYKKTTAVGEQLFVNDSDKFYDGIKMPNIVDLQYSSAGAAQ